MLNIGQNDLGDGFLRDIEDALIDNRSLLRLGIQSTNITGEGAMTLSNILTKNLVLQVSNSLLLSYRHMFNAKKYLLMKS